MSRRARSDTLPAMHPSLRWLVMSGSLAACQPVERAPAADPPASSHPESPPPPAAQPQGPASSPAQAGPPRLDPGVALGPFKLGMTRAEFEAVAGAQGLAVRAGFADANAYADPYFVAFTDPGARMSTIVAPFVEIGGVQLAGETLPPTLTEAKDIAARLGCGDEQLAEGGNFFACERGVMVERHQPGNVAHVRVQSEQAASLHE